MKQIFIFFLAALFTVNTVVAQKDNPVFLRIGPREITQNEFERLLVKNFTIDEALSVQEYLEMYINFQLKVLDAIENNIHLQPNFKEEYHIYRKHLARPYLSHPETEQAFMKEAYQHMKYDINASHILTRIENEANLTDTLMAYEKAIRIREQILAGEPFESVARRASDDPSAKVNSGNIGFFTAFQMIYPFEKAAYNMRPGVISMPVRSRFGYHIIKVHEKRNSPGQVKLQHILLRTSPNTGNEINSEQKILIEQLYDRMNKGEDFGRLAAEYSQDLSSKARNGEMDWFGTGKMIPEFEKEAFGLKAKGNVSRPFQTKHGWHIIKLLDKKQLASYDDLKEEIREMLYSARDERILAIQNKLIKTLKTDFGFLEEERNLDIFYNLPEAWFQSKEYGKGGRAFSNSPMFFISRQPVHRHEFASHLKKNISYYNIHNKQSFIDQQYKNFVEGKLIEEEEKLLEKKYPEFKYLAREYYDGLLLFEITEKKVWSKARTDSAGLEKFYLENKNNYLRPQELIVTVFRGNDQKLISNIHKFVSRATRRKYSEQGLVNKINRKFTEKNFSMNKKKFMKEENPPVENLKWEKGVTRVFREDSESYFFLVHEVIKPEPYQLEEIRGHLLTAYQDQLEKLWVKELREKFNVIIEKPVLSVLQKKYNN